MNMVCVQHYLELTVELIMDSWQLFNVRLWTMLTLMHMVRHTQTNGLRTGGHIFRRGYSNWVISFFKELVQNGKLMLGHPVHIEVCVVCIFQLSATRIKYG